MRWLLIALLVLLSTPSAAEDPPKPSKVVHHIGDDPGGEILEYIWKYVGWDHEHSTIIVDGECNSACTIALGIIDAENMCATDSGEFGFHSAWWGPLHRYTEDGTRLLWLFYNGRTSRLLKRNGWSGPSPHPDLLTIDATKFIRPCEPKDFSGE